MAYEINGKQIACNDGGYLENIDDWNEDVATAIAAEDGLELSTKHWDLINYLREEYLKNGGNQPNDRAIVKAMAKLWTGEKVDSKATYMLFPKQPSKQAAKIAGLPESRRKGGY